MSRSSLLLAVLGAVGVAQAQCPFADVGSLAARAQGVSRDHLSEYEVDDSEGYLTSDVGGNIEDQESLRAGDRGSVLLEDFIFRQKITHFDHERVRFINTESPQFCYTVTDLSLCRFLREQSMLAVLVLMAPSPATVTTATSPAPHSCQKKAKRRPSSSGSLLWLDQGAAPTRPGMCMDSRRDCEFLTFTSCPSME